jgi:hypothetical protein
MDFEGRGCQAFPTEFKASTLVEDLAVQLKLIFFSLTNSLSFQVERKGETSSLIEKRRRVALFCLLDSSLSLSSFPRLTHLLLLFFIVGGNT